MSTYWWPLEPMNQLLDRVKGKYFVQADVSAAYNQVPLDEEAKNLCKFTYGGVTYTHNRGFYGLSGLPSFFH